MLASGLLLAASAAAYVAYAGLSLNPPTGGTWPGLAFGIASTALVAFCALYGVRRRFPAVRVGRAENWLKAHIWLGLLAYPLALFHSGFRLGGTVTIALMALFTLLVASGVAGLVAQHILPRIMTERVPMETVYEQVERLLALFVEEADRAVAAVAGELLPEAAPLEAEAAVPAGAAAGGKEAEARGGAAAGKAAPSASSPPDARRDAARRRKPKPADPQPGGDDLRAFYLEVVRPFLEGKPSRALGDAASRSATFEQVRIQLPPPLHRTVLHLEEICEERRQLLEQRRLHHHLHGWLYLHVPATVALLVVLAAHAVMALRY
jgi:hypothetical protein